VYEEPLETVSPGPKSSLDAVQLLASLASQAQLAFNLVERLRGERSPNLRILGTLEALPRHTQGILGLEHAACGLLRHPDQLRKARDGMTAGPVAERVIRSRLGRHVRSVPTFHLRRLH
jgi:hypothetical protein